MEDGEFLEPCFNFTVKNLLCNINVGSASLEPTYINYSERLLFSGRRGCYHCHLKKGKPTYVAVWKVTDKKNRLVEVRYVGTHEKADYGRIC